MQRTIRKPSSKMAKVEGSTPASLGYRMPAEWAPHAATWLAWPHYHGDWPGKFEPIPWVYAEIIRNLARHEQVELLVNDAAAEKKVRKLLQRANADLNHVRFHRQPTNRVWLRDSGAIFVRQKQSGFALPGTRGRPFAHNDRNGQMLALNFRFTAWAKYSNFGHDQ